TLRRPLGVCAEQSMNISSPVAASTSTTSGSPPDCSISLSDQSLALLDASLACTALHARPAWRCMCASKRVFKVLSNSSRCFAVMSLALGILYALRLVSVRVRGVPLSSVSGTFHEPEVEGCEYQDDSCVPSLTGRRLPEFHLVSFRIDDPAKLSVLGVVDLFENIAAFFAQGADEAE